MMSGSLGLIGDLCIEADWIWRRMHQVQVALRDCRHPGLGLRLRAEARLHGSRCKQIQASLQQGSVLSSDKVQLRLLNELLDRSLQQSLSVQKS